MRIAPASDLMFSQSHVTNEPFGFAFPPRACATTFGFSAAGFFFVRFGTVIGDWILNSTPLSARGLCKRKAGHVRDMSRSFTPERRLLEVLVHELRHLEHRDAALAAEDRLHLLVGDDHAAFLRILQVVPLDVRP